MSDTTFQFRTATLGGFHKKDVLDYIEQSTHAHNEAVEGYKRVLLQEEQTRKELEAKVTDQAEAARVQEEHNRLLKKVEDELAIARASIEKANGERERLEKELEEITARFQIAEAGAQCYEAIKERTAGMELEALRRAQIIENRAQEQVELVWKQLEESIRVVTARYQDLRDQLATSAQTALVQVDQSRDVLVSLTKDFNGQDTSLEQILCQVSAREPLLLPLEE